MKGVVDRLEPTLVGGWVFEPDHPSRRLEVELVVDGKVVARALADRHRADLESAGIGDGGYAFRMEPDSPVRIDRVSVRVVGSDVVLPLDNRVRKRVEAAAEAAAASARYRSCVLHIGLEKTGTTSLQRFFGINHAALAAQGWHVPKSLAPHAGQGILNHIFLTTMAMRDDRFADDLRRANGVDSEEALAAHRASVAEALQAELAEFPRQGATLLLSNEHLHSRLRTPEELERLRDFLLGFAETIRVVIYLRPQHEVAASLFSTAIKNGFHDIRPLPDFGDARRSYVDPGFFDYDALLRRWADCFGAQSIDLRLYTREEMIGGDIINDFCFRTGIELAELRALDERQNVSLSARAERIMLALNGALADAPPHEAQAMRQRIERLFAEFEPKSGRGIKPSRAEARRFQERFAAINDAVRQRWMPSRSDLFDTSFSSLPEKPDSVTLGADEAAQFMLFLLRAAPQG